MAIMTTWAARENWGTNDAWRPKINSKPPPNGFEEEFERD
jgi:hypothetical protein